MSGPDPFRFTRVVFSDTEPTIDPTWRATDWKWFDTSKHRWYELVGASWVLASGNVDFAGTVSVSGVAGLTGEYEGTFKKIKVVNGIITEFELV